MINVINQPTDFILAGTLTVEGLDLLKERFRSGPLELTWQNVLAPLARLSEKSDVQHLATSEVEIKINDLKVVTNSYLNRVELGVEFDCPDLDTVLAGLVKIPANRWYVRLSAYPPPMSKAIRNFIVSVSEGLYASPIETRMSFALAEEALA